MPFNQYILRDATDAIPLRVAPESAQGYLAGAEVWGPGPGRARLGGKGLQG